MALISAAPPGAFHAQMPQILAVNEPTKIVIRITGHGPLSLTASSSDGLTIKPDRLDPHADDSSWSGIVPGDEWGTGWTFPSVGCWRLHAVRDDVVSDIDFAVAVPKLVDATFTIASPRTVPVHSGQKIVFAVQPDVRPGSRSAPVIVRITITHGGRTYRVLKRFGAATRQDAATRIHVRTTTSFTAIALITFKGTTLTRTLHFRVTSA